MATLVEENGVLLYDAEGVTPDGQTEYHITIVLPKEARSLLSKIQDSVFKIIDDTIMRMNPLTVEMNIDLGNIYIVAKTKRYTPEVYGLEEDYAYEEQL